jgi:hypothetical protein
MATIAAGVGEFLARTNDRAAEIAADASATAPKRLYDILAA